MQEMVILVDEKDRPLGTQEKLQAHLIPQRHRAFSVFVFNAKGETLIQRRALEKYHSPGLWANSCCGHPRPHEEVGEGAKRRLGEELGFTCSLTPMTTVCYTLKLEKDLWELEYTHVFRGLYENAIAPNPEEVMELKWISPEALREDVLAHPESYARWFRLYVLKHFEVIFSNRRTLFEGLR
jgi:isopentenyl-diphosphate delta-isomerase